jgi:hypothetical protein
MENTQGMKLLDQEAKSIRNYTKMSKNEEKVQLHRATMVLDRAIM